MNIRLRDVSFYKLPMRTRFPFRYGIATLTELPHLFVRAEVEIDGTRCVGMSADGLPPKWFTKNPDSSFEDDDLPEMLAVIRAAADTAMEVGGQQSFFDWWWRLYDLRSRRAEQDNIPLLLNGLGVSLVERAVLDAFCRHAGRPLHELAASGALGLQFGMLWKDLAGIKPSDFVVSPPSDSIIVRHTIGMADPLTDAEISPADQLHDGLPHSLEACIRRYGLTHFKIKLQGDLQVDRERLREIARIIAEAGSADCKFTLDGNENYTTIDDFRQHWNELRSDAALTDFFEHSLLFVEQPLHRDVALKDKLRLDDDSWVHPPPIIIDESDAKISSFPRARICGYRGTSHKNCKGVLKSMLNAAEVAWGWQNKEEIPGFLSAEDLGNVGPVALLQDLAVVALLGIDHVERNGHHFFAGLSMFPEAEQVRVLNHHSDLYERSDTGFATLKIRDGRINLTSVNAAPFGVAEHPDMAHFERWEF